MSYQKLSEVELLSAASNDANVIVEDGGKIRRVPKNKFGGGASSWNDLTDKPFGETTVTSDTLTWDLNRDGLLNVMDMFYHVSDTVPTLEDLQNGGILNTNQVGTETPLEFTIDYVMDTGTGIIAIDQFCVIAQSDGVEMEGVILPKAGVYFVYAEQDGMSLYAYQLTINGYAGFETTETKPIEPKYLPKDDIINFVKEALPTWEGGSY